VQKIRSEKEKKKRGDSFYTKPKEKEGNRETVFYCQGILQKKTKVLGIGEKEKREGRWGQLFLIEKEKRRITLNS